MLFEDVEKQVNLNKLYKELNGKYFNNFLPIIPCKWSGKLKKAVGRATVQYKSTEPISKSMVRLGMGKDLIEIDMKSLKIKISGAFDLTYDDVSAVMLHEMVHIKLYVQKNLSHHHGTPVFDGEITRLRSESGLNIPLLESDFKSSPKIQPKEAYMIILNTTGGYGFFNMAVQGFEKKWKEHIKIFARIIAQSTKVKMLDVVRGKHIMNATNPPKRGSKRGISWIQISKDDAEDMIKKGKHIVQLGFYKNMITRDYGIGSKWKYIEIGKMEKNNLSPYDISIGIEGMTPLLLKLNNKGYIIEEL